MELHQLRYFAAVARLGNFTRAAEACHVSQPTLSQQIAKLEQELGRPLFDRLGRGAALTDAGRAFQSRVDQALAMLEDAKETVTTDAKAGRLTVAAIPTIAPFLLPAPLVRFAKAHPRARVEVREYTTAECLARLADGEIDIAVLALPVVDENLRTEVLFTEELLLAVPTGHPLAKRPKVSLQAVTDEPFVLLHEAHCLSGQAIGFCARHALAPVVTARLHQIGMVLELVRFGHGVSLVPAMAAGKHPGVVFKSLAGDKPTRTVAAAWNAMRFRGPQFEDFLAELRAAPVRGK